MDVPPLYIIYIYIIYIYVYLCIFLLARLRLKCLWLVFASLLDAEVSLHPEAVLLDFQIIICSAMASKKDEKTFAALMKSTKVLLPPKSMKTYHRFFKARVTRWVRAIVKGNMHKANVWARWSDIYDAVVLGQEVAKGNGKATEVAMKISTAMLSDMEIAMNEAFSATSIVPIRYCPQCGKQVCSPSARTRNNYCTQCGVKFPHKHFTCNRCGAPTTCI